MAIVSTAKISRTLSPTRSMTAWKSGCSASAAPISLMTASSALRCRVSSLARAWHRPRGGDGKSRDTGRPAGAHRLPDCGVGDVGIQLVHVVGVVEQLALLVVERDVEVLGVHQLAHDGGPGRVELGHLGGRAGGG